MNVSMLLLFQRFIYLVIVSALPRVSVDTALAFGKHMKCMQMS